MKSNDGYIKIVAMMQKYFDQAISGNWSYNPLQYDNNEVPLSVMATDMLNAYKYGWKTSYYQNTYDFKGEEEDLQPAGIEPVVARDDGEDVELHLVNGHVGTDSMQSIEESDDCDACKI